MSLQLNEVRICGNLARDPVVKVLTGGAAKARFQVASNRRWKSDDGKQQQEATFVECEAWGKTAEFLNTYFVKGNPIYVAGRLKLEQWTKDGQRRSRLIVTAEHVSFVESNHKGGAS